MHRLYLIFIIISYSVTISCQIDEDFSSGDLSRWSGDINSFVINAEGQLQLNDIDAGKSSIYINTSYSDSINWSMDVEMDFSPSVTNKLTILLASDNSDLSIANAYILEIGENGSDDAIHLVEIIDGNSSIIASGPMGQVSEEFVLNFNVTYDSDKVWTLKTSTINSILSQESFRVSYPATIDFNSLTIFGFECSYTSTRADKFFFDNIKVEELLADEEAPIINSVQIINDQQIQIILDEAVDEILSSDPNNYSITPQTDIDRVEIDPSIPNIINVYTSTPIQSGTVITLIVSGISDTSGNTIDSQDYNLRLLEAPDVGDVLINEILFDPYSGGEDFVEIINASDKFLDLNGLIILNMDNQNEETITESIELLPNQILAISPDINNIKDIYNPPDTARLYEQDIPAFNNDDGNVSLLIIQADGSELIIDSYDYDDSQHLSILSDVEGVSLERLSLISDSNNPDNWTSSSEANLFATPGYSNSARINPGMSDDQVSLEHKVFSPNRDGQKDNLILNYNLAKSGYIANVSIYDDRGRLELHLAENQLLATTGFIKWDGLDADGRTAPIGMYIVYYELFHSDGDIIEGKKVCVLAQNLN